MKNSLPFIFKKKLFIFLTAGFIVASQTGMFLHECGHYAVAKCLGYESHIKYGYTHWENPKTKPYEDSIFAKHNTGFRLDSNDFPGKQKYLEILNRERSDAFWITAGGPLETMLTGTIGFMLLLTFRKSFKEAEKLITGQWIIVFTALSWLRQTANLFTGFSRFITGHSISAHGGLSDEIYLANDLKLPEWSISGFTGIIGILVLYTVVFKYIPVSQRMTFLISGLAGGLIGLIFVNL